MDRGYTPKRFVSLFYSAIADRQIDRFIESELGPLPKTSRGRPVLITIKGKYHAFHVPFWSCYSAGIQLLMEVVDYEYLTGSQNVTVIKELSITGENKL